MSHSRYKYDHLSLTVFVQKPAHNEHTRKFKLRFPKKHNRWHETPTKTHAKKCAINVIITSVQLSRSICTWYTQTTDTNTIGSVYPYMAHTHTWPKLWITHKDPPSTPLSSLPPRYTSLPMTSTSKITLLNPPLQPLLINVKYSKNDLKSPISISKFTISVVEIVSLTPKSSPHPLSYLS